MKKKLIAALCFAMGISAPALATNSYDPVTGYVTIDSIAVGATTYQNVVISIKNVISVGGSATAPIASSSNCTRDNLNQDKIAAIQAGQELVQVKQIFGCDPDPAYTTTQADYVSYSWWVNDRTGYITIYFDVTGNTVTPMSGYSGFIDSVRI